VALAIGERRALELSLTGRIFGAEEALQWGLVQQVVPASELEERASQTAAGVAAWSQEAIRRGLEFVQQARGRSWDEAGALGAVRALPPARVDFPKQLLNPGGGSMQRGQSQERIGMLSSLTGGTPQSFFNRLADPLAD
jgi:hypothetical protein